MARARLNRARFRRERAFKSGQRQAYPIKFPVLIVPATATLTLTELAPGVATPRLVTPAAGSLVLAEFAPSVATPRLVAPAKASLALSEFAPTVSTPRLVTPATHALVLTGFALTVTATANVLVAPASAQLNLAGFAATITGQVIQPSQGGSAGAGVPYRRVRIHEPQARIRPPAMPEPRVPLVVQPVVESDDEEALVALYAAGAIDLEEFAALIAA
jgi:hypothetical protein